MKNLGSAFPGSAEPQLGTRKRTDAELGLGTQKRNIKMEMNWKEESNETLVCFCSQVDKGTVVAAIKDGAADVKTIQEQTKAGVGGRCMELNPRGRCCHPDIKKLLELYS